MTKNNELLPQLCEEDNTMPTVRVLIMFGDETLLNKIVSKKATIKEILVANNLDPDRTYLMDQRILDIDKTILEIVPKSKAQLAEVELFIETSPIDLDSKHEIRYDPIVKPIEKPFRTVSFNPKTYNISMKIYPDSTIKNLNLDQYSDAYSAYCNTPKDLYISGGKGKANKLFWKVNKQNYAPDKLQNLIYPKEEHTMYYVPNKYIYFIGGNGKKHFCTIFLIIILKNGAL